MVDMPSSEFTTKMEMNLAQSEPLAECGKGSITKGHVWGKSRTGKADTVTSVLHFYACTFFWTD